jgi:hypothetical protein
MLNDKEYVFILGAGASMDFGFPSGLTLVEEAIVLLTKDKAVTEIIVSLCDFPSLIEPFVNALRNSGMQSIDAFLERQDAEYNAIGKLVIAACLLPYENEESLYNPKLKQVNWYDYVFQRMTEGVVAYEDFRKNKVTFLTYNYDRTLEHYLLNALEALYPRNPKDTLEVLEELPIVHLHGDLGSLINMNHGHNRSTGVTFGQRVSNYSLREAAKRIRIIHENITKEPQFEKAHLALAKADVVGFLGFGFHPKNVERLKLKKIRCEQFYATLYELKKGEVANIEGMFQGRRFEAFPTKIRDFFRETGLLLGEPPRIFEDDGTTFGAI